MADLRIVDRGPDVTNRFAVMDGGIIVSAHSRWKQAVAALEGKPLPTKKRKPKKTEF